jgi:predicted metal-dependent TIM-barrel fold hydrolase
MKCPVFLKTTDRHCKHLQRKSEELTRLSYVNMHVIITCGTDIYQIKKKVQSMSAFFQCVAITHVKAMFSIGCGSVTPRINIATFSILSLRISDKCM